MDPQQHLDQVVARMTGAGFTVTPNLPFAGTTALMGHTSEFRWRWMATRLHLLVYAQAVDTVSVYGLEQFAGDALEHAMASKGNLRGLQVGVAVVPLQIGARVGDRVREYAEHEIVKRYAAFAWPVVIDATSGAVARHQGRPVFGTIYASWMRQQIDAVTGGDSAGR